MEEANTSRTPDTSVPPSREQSPESRARHHESTRSRLGLDGLTASATEGTAVGDDTAIGAAGEEGPPKGLDPDGDDEASRGAGQAEASVTAGEPAAAADGPRSGIGVGHEASGGPPLAGASGPRAVEDDREGAAPVAEGDRGEAAAGPGASALEPHSRDGLTRAATTTSLASRSGSARSLQHNATSLSRSQSQEPLGQEASVGSVARSSGGPWPTLGSVASSASRVPAGASLGDLEARVAAAAAAVADDEGTSASATPRDAEYDTEAAGDGLAPAQPPSEGPTQGKGQGQGQGLGRAQGQRVTAQNSQLVSNSSVPSLGIGNSTLDAGRNRPSVMPFAERHPANRTVAEQQQQQQRRKGSGSARAPGSPAPSGSGQEALGAPVGKRQGPHGTVRHGPTHAAPQPHSGGSAGPREEPRAPRSRQGERDPSHTGSGAPASGRSPLPTGEGTSDQSLPPHSVYQASSREWDKVRSSGGYAAGGGVAAVKAAAAKNAATAAAAATTADQLLQKQLTLGEAISIRGIHKPGPASSSFVAQSLPAGPGGGALGIAGVPGRRGRRIVAHPSSSSATAVAMAAYFASVEASIADGTAAAKVLLPSGLARRLKAARMMASGPPPFQRRKERPPPPSPAGIKLDGFMLLEAADEEMPEAVQAATLESRHISSVESADLAYFVALRSLDVSDNKLPDLVCLANLQALVRLRAASCRLITLGSWPGAAAAAAAGTAAEGGEGGYKGGPAAATSSAGGSRRSSARARGTQGVGADDGEAATGSGVEGEGVAGEPAAEAGPDGLGSGSGGEGGDEVQGGPGRPAPDGIEPGTVAADGGGEGGEPAPLTEEEVAAKAAAEAAALMASLLAPPTHPFRYLEVLDLSYNQLQAHMVLMPGTPLALLPRLVELDLSSNHLKQLPAPSEILAAAEIAAAAADSGEADGRGDGAVAFPALRRLRLADNGLKGAALASLAALAPPCLTHLDLSRNAISEAPRLAFLSPGGDTSAEGTTRHQQYYQLEVGHNPHHYPQQQQQQQPWPARTPQEELEDVAQLGDRFGGVLVRLAVLDLTCNKVATEAAVAPLLHMPALQRLLLAGNPIVVARQRPHAKPGASGAQPHASKMDFGDPAAGPAKPSVATSLTARFARITETAPKQQTSTLVVAAAAAITAAAAPERVAEAFERMDATIEQWRLNTVMEEDEEEGEDDGEEGPEDHTFLTGVGIQEKRRRGSAAASSAAALDDVLEPLTDEPEAQEAPPQAAPAPAPHPDDDRPLWESITDPTERVAVALGLDPLALPMHTGSLTVDSAGAIAALRFALAHPLVEADDGLAPHPRYAATTTAAQLKRRPRRPVPTQRLAPVGASAASVAASAATGATTVTTSASVAGPKAAKILTVEAMLDGMKGKLAALEASLAAQLAAAPPALPPQSAAARGAKGGGKGARYGESRRAAGGGQESESDDGDDDAGSSGSELPDDVIDQIERESESEEENEQRALEEEFTPLDPMQGIVLVADQLMAEEDGADVPRMGSHVSIAAPGPGPSLAASRSQSMSPSRGALSTQPSRSPVTRISSPPSMTNTRQQSIAAQRSLMSPQRTGTAASGAGGLSRKNLASPHGAGGGGAGGQGPGASPPGLSGGAASALGYAA